MTVRQWRYVALAAAFALMGVLLPALFVPAAGHARLSTGHLSRPGISRDTIISRAQVWVDEHIPYSSAKGPDGYRHDCSGYVDMAWELTGGPDTVALEMPDITTPITRDQLDHGDILDNGLSGDDGHVVIFDRWAPGSETSHNYYYSYEETPTYKGPGGPGQYVGGAVHITGAYPGDTRGIPYPYWQGSEGNYKPFRFNGIDSTGGGGSGLGDVSGRVISSSSQQGIADVPVTFVGSGTSQSTTSDGSGRYVFQRVPAGIATISATSDGYLAGSISVVIVQDTTIQASDLWLYPVCVASAASGTGIAARPETGGLRVASILSVNLAPLEPNVCSTSTATPAVLPTSTPGSSGLSCHTPALSSPAGGGNFSQSDDVTLYWDTDCPQSYTELWGGPYGTLNFGGWQPVTSVDIGQMWPGTYSWHVNGMDGNGNQTGYSATWTFTVQASASPTATATNTPPPGVACATPTLSSPSDGSSYAQTDDITLYWNTNCAQSYAELWGGPYGTLNFGGWQPVTSVDIGQMWPGTYSWHVNGMDGNGNQTGYSATWTFTVQASASPTATATNTPPPGVACAIPSLSSPGNGDSYPQTQDITLYWNTNCAQAYVELWGGPYGTLNFGGWQPVTSIHIGQMWPGTYSWHVNGMDGNGNQTGYSGTWTFTIQSSPGPTDTPTATSTPTPPPSAGCSTPSLSSPPNGASYAQSTSITLYWNTNCPQSYTELWGGPYSTLNFGGWNPRTSLTIGQMWPGTYTWHVNGMDYNGNQTGFSGTWTFTIQSSAPNPSGSSSRGSGSMRRFRVDTNAPDQLGWLVSPLLPLALRRRRPRHQRPTNSGRGAMPLHGYR